jgi:Rrf2 family protein
MLLTKASEYALLSLIIIAKKDTAQDVDTLSSTLGISKSFLAKILQSFAKEGILKSYKGARGGFTLANSADKISIREIIECAERRPTAVFECASNTSCCKNDRGDYCKIRPFFNKFQDKIDDFLNSITLADVLND